MGYVMRLLSIYSPIALAMRYLDIVGLVGVRQQGQALGFGHASSSFSSSCLLYPRSIYAAPLIRVSPFVLFFHMPLALASFKSGGSTLSVTGNRIGLGRGKVQVTFIPPPSALPGGATGSSDCTLFLLEKSTWCCCFEVSPPQPLLVSF